MGNRLYSNVGHRADVDALLSSRKKVRVKMLELNKPLLNGGSFEDSKEGMSITGNKLRETKT